MKENYCRDECQYFKNGICLTPADFHSCEKSENRKEIMRLAKQLYPLMLTEGVTHIDFYDGAVLTLTYKGNETKRHDSRTDCND